jgi:hypothetical protein
VSTDRSPAAAEPAPDLRRPQSPDRSGATTAARDRPAVGTLEV